MTQKELIEKWRSRCQRYQLAHRLNGKSFAALHLWIGIPTTFLAAIAGFLTSQSTNPSLLINIPVIIVFSIGLTVPAMTALQTFLRSESRSNAHQDTDALYGEVKEQLELILVRLSTGQSISDDELNELQVKMHNARSSAPHVSERFWKRARKKLQQK